MYGIYVKKHYLGRVVSEYALVDTIQMELYWEDVASGTEILVYRNNQMPLSSDGTDGTR